MEVRLQSITPRIEDNIVEIARVSSSRTDKTEDPTGLINYLIKNNHWSPFEHGFITMEIDTSKAIGIQLLRHRSFTFQELSQRYAVVGASEPIELRRQHKNNRQSSDEVFDPIITIEDFTGYDGKEFPKLPASELIANHIEYSQELYKELLDAGVARECARMVLPMSTSTTIFMSGTVRSWIHMLDIRDDSHAQLEAQLIAKEMKSIFIKELPLISKARGWIKN
jgi:thymidylate synthase (FAD)